MPPHRPRSNSMLVDSEHRTGEHGDIRDTHFTSWHDRSHSPQPRRPNWHTVQQQYAFPYVWEAAHPLPPVPGLIARPTSQNAARRTDQRSGIKPHPAPARLDRRLLPAPVHASSSKPASAAGHGVAGPGGASTLGPTNQTPNSSANPQNLPATYPPPATRRPDLVDTDFLRRHKAFSKRDGPKLAKEVEYARDPTLVEVVPTDKCRRCASQHWRCFIERDPNSPRRVCRPCGKNKCSFGNATKRPNVIHEDAPRFDIGSDVSAAPGDATATIPANTPATTMGAPATMGLDASAPMPSTNKTMHQSRTTISALMNPLQYQHGNGFKAEPESPVQELTTTADGWYPGRAPGRPSPPTVAHVPFPGHAHSGDHIRGVAPGDWHPMAAHGPATHPIAFAASHQHGHPHDHGQIQTHTHTHPGSGTRTHSRSRSRHTPSRLERWEDGRRCGLDGGCEGDCDTECSAHEHGRKRRRSTQHLSSSSSSSMPYRSTAVIGDVSPVEPVFPHTPISPDLQLMSSDADYFPMYSRSCPTSPRLIPSPVGADGVAASNGRPGTASSLPSESPMLDVLGGLLKLSGRSSSASPMDLQACHGAPDSGSGSGSGPSRASGTASPSSSAATSLLTSPSPPTVAAVAGATSFPRAVPRFVPHPPPGAHDTCCVDAGRLTAALHEVHLAWGRDKEERAARDASMEARARALEERCAELENWRSSVERTGVCVTALMGMAGE